MQTNLRSAARITAAFGLALLIAGTPRVGATDPSSKPADAGKKKPAQSAASSSKDAPPVFTNKSLDSLPPPPPVTSLAHVGDSTGTAVATADAGSGDGPVVFTNDTLDKMFGKSTPPPPPADAKPVGEKGEGADAKDAPLDPLAAIQKEKEDAAKQQQAVAQAQADVAKAEANVQELQKRLLADHNPFLPRPKLSPEEQQKEEGMNGGEKVARTQEELDLAKKELERAQQQLGQLQPQQH